MRHTFKFLMKLINNRLAKMIWKILIKIFTTCRLSPVSDKWCSKGNRTTHSKYLSRTLRLKIVIITIIREKSVQLAIKPKVNIIKNILRAASQQPMKKISVNIKVLITRQKSLKDNTKLHTRLNHLGNHPRLKFFTQLWWHSKDTR